MILDYIQKKFVPNHFPDLPNKLLSPHLPFLTKKNKTRKIKTFSKKTRKIKNTESILVQK